jgi:hypothetical protein
VKHTRCSTLGCFSAATGHSPQIELNLEKPVLCGGQAQPHKAIVHMILDDQDKLNVLSILV